MNTKRQTIWLVSMLSLMVVLSAYYLFTQDIDPAGPLTDSTQTEQAGSNATEAATNGSGIVVNEVKDNGGTISGADLEVLKQLESQGIASAGIFADLMDKRETQNSEEENRIMSEITKATQGKPEESAAAAAKLDQFEDRVSRIAGLEAELMKEYEMALVDEEGEHFKVVVASEGLEKKQAAEIIKKVMGTMEVAANQVSVQYVSQ